MTSSASYAEQLAFTDFNDSTLGTSNNIKTGLNWVLNGLDDPGDLIALNAGGGNQAIFDGNSFVQDIFIPGLNVGNGDTFWTTDVSLTVAAGTSVTLTDVTFHSVSVSGGQAENVNRRNDYTLTLFDPSSAIVEEITIGDTVAGTAAGQPLITFDFEDVALSAPGTYTLRIKGGDFVDPNETGNHTGFDNLSINGTIGGGLPGDTDGDGDIDDTDLGTAFSNYTGPNGSGKTAEQGDTDSDGDVDDSDLGTLFSAYTGPLGPAAVPEPASLTLIAIAAFALARRRRA
ncbi:MAG: PEP-CTERM sorting domain-containing protein [Phycisphaeraceae bacterium]